VSDQDFNFNPPPRREAKKAFEPPPWEREQFEELARRREDEHVVEGPTVEGEETFAAAEPVGEMPPAVIEVGPSAKGPGLTPQPVEGPSPEEDPRIEAMMIGLRNEEPAFGSEIWKAGIASGVVLASVGAVLIVWGVFAIAAASRAGLIGLLGGVVLLVFGFGFAGVGGWMAFRILRQRGVL